VAGEPGLDRAETLGREVDELPVALDEGAADATAGGEEAGGAGEGGERHDEQDDPKALAVLGHLDAGEEHQQVGGDGAGDAEFLDEDQDADDEQSMRGQERVEATTKCGGEDGHVGLLIGLLDARRWSARPSQSLPLGIS